MKVNWPLLIISLMCGMLMGTILFNRPTQPLSGPYHAHTFGGQVLDARYDAWWNEKFTNFVIFPDSDRSFGYTLSIQVPTGQYEVRGKCVIHLDLEKNGHGDRNPALKSPNFSVDHQVDALIEIPVDADGCQITAAAPAQ